MKELVPRLDRLAVLTQRVVTSQAASHQDRIVADIETSARALSVQVLRFAAGTGDELDQMFADMRRERVQAALAVAGTLFGSHHERLGELTLRHRLPVMYELATFVEAGALISYGVKLSDRYRLAAGYVDKILKGARAGDLPIEQPTKFELVINQKTAKALGLTIPPSLLARADHVIQ
jgi:putative ABC transport system substrate-binding protein